ncbi:hypothetical protein D3C80_2224210 [compost metagenome]
MGVGDLRQSVEAVDRRDDVAADLFQQCFRGAANRFRIVDHHNLQAIGMLFHVRPYTSVNRCICLMSVR